MSIKVITNNVPRDVIEAWELSAGERKRFNYLDWAAIDDGQDSASFFRYKGELHDIGEFSADYGITKGTGLPVHLSDWHGYRADSFYSALVIRYVDDDRLIVGLVLS